MRILSSSASLRFPNILISQPEAPQVYNKGGFFMGFAVPGWRASALCVDGFRLSGFEGLGHLLLPNFSDNHPKPLKALKPLNPKPLKALNP